MPEHTEINTTENHSSGSSFSPLQHTLFAVIWTATVLGNTGSFIRDVASSWLITDLSASPAAVSMIQVAGTLPIFLLAIPAGVLSDIIDRRKLLIFIQIWLALTSASLVFLSYSGLLTVNFLIILTFMGGIGAALMGPVWQAIVPELVSKKDLKNAIALNSLGINIARAIGPALGGLLLASFGAAFAYSADVISYLFIIGALLWWKRPEKEENELSEHFGGAFRAGIRYARSNRELHIVLLRTLIFFAFASSIWALLPLIARQLLNGDAGFYGILLASIGIGAIMGAFLLSFLRSHLNSDGLVLFSGLLCALVIGLLSLAPAKTLAVFIMLFLGVAWIISLTTLNSTAQSILPNWVRGRALAIYLTVFNGAMAAGSFFWGVLAQHIGIPSALLTAAAGLTVVSLILYRIKLPTGEDDLSPSHHWQDPFTAIPVAQDRGPVMVMIEYKIAERDKQDFHEAARHLARIRRRDGAYAWGLMEDIEKQEKVIEWFLVESWAEHLRQHNRISHHDADLQKTVTRFHQGPDEPVVNHFLTIEQKP